MMHNNKITLMLLGMATFPGVLQNAEAANWRLSSSLAVTETYSDNVNLDSQNRQSDFVTQVTPNVSVTGSGRRLNVSFSYAPNYFFYPGSDDDKHDLRHSLQASLSSEMIRETFFVESSVSIAQRFLDRRQAISSVDVTRTNNRDTVQSYRFSPYLRHAFGTLATAVLRYDLGHVRTDDSARQTTADTLFGNSLNHTGSFTLSSGREFTRLGWALSAQYSTEKRESLSNFERTSAIADFSYRVNRMLSLLGSAGYEKRNSVGGSFSNFNGFVWDAGIRLTPGPRTSLSVRYGNQNDGATFSADGRYQITASNVISLSYSDTIRTFQSFAFDNDSNIVLDPSLGGGFLSGDLTRRKRGTLAVSGTRGRTTYSASAFYSTNISDNSNLDEKRYGGGLSISRRMSRRLTFSGAASYNLSRFSSDNINDKFLSASVNVNYNISQSLSGNLGYIFTDRDQRRFGNLNRSANFISLSIRAAL